MVSHAKTLAGRRILLGVTGSIAAYKAPILLRALMSAGAQVKVLLSASAEKFIGKAVFQGLGAETHTDMWKAGGELHVALGKWADLILVAPATADTLARMTQGRADDLLTATLLCASCPVVVAPAMHPVMWGHPATQANVSTLSKRGVVFFGPSSGEVASGDIGLGRMLEPADIATGLDQLLGLRATALSGKHVVITAGPTREVIDPVRALTNHSTGKMGYALAASALAQGARVTLISGPVQLSTPAGARLVQVETALQMQAALAQVLGPDLTEADVLIMSAAVADYRPAAPATEKLKRAREELTLTLVPNPDLLADIGGRRTSRFPVLIGFALETATGDQLIQLGRKKLVQKRVDLIVANSASESLGLNESVVRLVSAVDCIPLERLPKIEVAEHILRWVGARLNEPAEGDTSA